ncbi:MAG: SDR family oxidoreductase [Xenococcaceae cyanobacterium]
MNFSKNKLRAIITGASSGIGKETALAFAKAGIDVAVIGRSLDRLEAVASAAREIGVKSQAYPLNLSDLSDIREKIAAIALNFGDIDILVNNAGMGYTNHLADTPLNEWQQIIDLNLTSVFQCVQGILPQMRARSSGTIVNVASIAASNFFSGWGAYSVSKAGLIAFSKTLAVEERANGIRVISISPGSVNTPIWDTDTVKADFDRSAMLKPEVVAQSILYAAMLPAGAVLEEMTIMPSAGAL